MEIQTSIIDYWFNLSSRKCIVNNIIYGTDADVAVSKP